MPTTPKWHLRRNRGRMYTVNLRCHCRSMTSDLPWQLPATFYFKKKIFILYVAQMNVSSAYEHKHVFFFMKNADMDSIFIVKTVSVKHSWRVFSSHSGKFFALCLYTLLNLEILIKHCVKCFYKKESKEMQMLLKAFRGGIHTWKKKHFNPKMDRLNAEWKIL